MRTLLWLVSILLSGALSWAFHWPLPVVPEASLGARAGIAAIGFGLLFFLLFPLWLPAVVPSRFKGATRVISVACAALLFVLALLAVLFQTVAGVLSVPLSLVAVFAIFGAVLHGRRSRVGGVPHVV